MEKILDENSLIINENEKLIANILHDVKSPLYSIKIGLMSHLDCELNRDIYETTVGIIDYIENFLASYSFKKGKFQNKIEPCNIKKIIYEKIENHKYIFINKNICVDIFADPKDIKINSIQIFLSSIMGNIISNIAVHAKENERARIDIKKKQDIVFVEFKNYYCSQNSNFSLGLDFCNVLAEYCKTELKLTKTKNEIKVLLKIHELNC